MGWLVIKKRNKMKIALVDCLRMLHIAHDMLEDLGWEEDFKEHIKKVFSIYKVKLDNEKVLKKDINAIIKYLECINTFDKKKIYKKGEKLVS
jgi:hypothetical protein